MHDGNRYSLVGDKRLPTDKILGYQDFGEGRFTYRVKAEKDIQVHGKPMRLFILEIQSAELTDPNYTRRNFAATTKLTRWLFAMVDPSPGKRDQATSAGCAPRSASPGP
jgi:hypothetical protein